MTKKIKNLQSLKSTKFSPAIMAVFAVTLAVAGYFIIFSKAAPAPPTIYLNPASVVVGPNGTVTVDVRENSGTTAVNAVQANFTYPIGLLTFVSIDGCVQSGTTCSAPFGTQAESTGASGLVKIGRGIAAATVTGDQLVARVTFNAGATGGAATMAFASGTALVAPTTPNPTDLLGGSLANTAGGTYTIDATAPSVSVTAPANNASIALGSTPTISVSASDASSTVTKVEVYIDGALKTTLTTSPYNYVWNTGVTAGAHTIQAKAYDTFNNIGTSTTVNVNVTDQTAPTVSITAPAANSFVAGSAVAVSANSADNVGVVGVQFKLDGANLGVEDTVAPYSVTWNTTGATNAAHTITAVARDAAGNTTTSTAVTATVDNATPTVSITAPAAGSIVNGSVTVNMNASDNAGGSGISKVELYVDGTLTGTDTTSPYSIAWNTAAIPFGTTHALTAKAYDNVTTPNTTTSTAVNVTVNDTTPPSAPTALHTTTVLPTSIGIAWTASTDNVAVTGYQVRRGGTLLTTTASLSYTDSSLTPATAYSYTVTAVDAAGNASTAATLNASTLSLKSGDINLDNAVDLTDLSLLISSYSSSSDTCVTNSALTCGLTAPAGVDIFDLSVLLSNYGT
jgi:YD repeat-containing protein